MDIVPFDRRAYDRSSFDCGNEEMNDWIRTKVTTQDKANNTRTFLAVSDGKVLGYYATCAYQLGLDDASLAFGIGKKRYPMPAILIARMAVDVSAQGMGLAKELLVDCLQKIVDISNMTGVELVVVDAIDTGVVAFYTKHGFTRFEDHALKLFMTTKTLRATFQQAE